MKEQFLAALQGTEYPIYLKLKITPQSPQTKILEQMSDGTWKIAVAAAPEKNKANKELVKFFKKELKLNIDILAGKTDRSKLIKINAPN